MRILLHRALPLALVSLTFALPVLPQGTPQCGGSTGPDVIVGDLNGVTKPVCLIWGDKDVMAPPELLEAYRPLPARMKDFELHVFPGILHGYMMPSHKDVYDAKTREFSMKRARAILEGLRA